MWPPSPRFDKLRTGLQGAIPAARLSRFCGIYWNGHVNRVEILLVRHPINAASAAFFMGD